MRLAALEVVRGGEIESARPGARISVVRRLLLVVGVRDAFTAGRALHEEFAEYGYYNDEDGSKWETVKDLANAIGVSDTTLSERMALYETLVLRLRRAPEEFEGVALGRLYEVRRIADAAPTRWRDALDIARLFTRGQDWSNRINALKLELGIKYEKEAPGGTQSERLIGRLDRMAMTRVGTAKELRREFAAAPDHAVVAWWIPPAATPKAVGTKTERAALTTQERRKRNGN